MKEVTEFRAIYYELAATYGIEAPPITDKDIRRTLSKNKAAREEASRYARALGQTLVRNIDSLILDLLKDGA